jgi:UDP-glucose 4-epimerase
VKKILILGGAGFLGEAIVNKLLKYKYKITVIDNKEIPQNRSKKIHWIQNDAVTALKKLNIDKYKTIIYLASNLLPNTRVNLRNLFHKDINSLIKVLGTIPPNHRPRLIFASSGGTVYGVSNGKKLNENAPTNPINFYGISKLTQEKILLMYDYLGKIDLVVLRISNAYGPRPLKKYSQGLISNLLYSLRRNKRIGKYFNKKTIRNFVHTDDIAAAFLKAVIYKGPYKIFNIGNTKNTNIANLMKMAEYISNKKLIFEPKVIRLNDVQCNNLCVKRAQAHLKWKAKIPLLQGLSQLFKQD